MNRKLDIQPGDTVTRAVVNGKERQVIGVVLDVYPMSTDEFDGSNESSDDKWSYGSFQRAYWKDTYNIELTSSKNIVLVAFIPHCKQSTIFAYPDEMIHEIVKNKTVRAFMNELSRDRQKLGLSWRDKRGLRKDGCSLCRQPIHWWQRVEYRCGYDVDVIHKFHEK